jgi:hypothetical protein
MAVLVHAVARGDLPPFRMSARFRTDIAYFMTPGDQPGAPALGPGEYWVRADDARRWLDEGGFSIVSPLSSEARAQIELTEEQEAWLEWLLRHGVEQVRLTQDDAPRTDR